MGLVDFLSKANLFRNAIAGAAGVSAADVGLDVVVEGSAGEGGSSAGSSPARRRLLAQDTRIDFTVRAASIEAANQIEASLTADNINRELTAVGMPVATVLKAASAITSVASPIPIPLASPTTLESPPPPPPSSGGNGGGGGDPRLGIIVGAVAGVVYVIGGALV